jgi:CBS domain-containing protein
MARVRELMSKQIVAVSKNASLGSAIKLMRRAHVSVLPVLEGTTLSGLIGMEEAEREQERWGNERKLSELRLRLLFAEELDEPERVAKLMVTNKISRLPVVNNAIEMKCVGIISSTEIARSHKKKIL